MTWIQNKFFSDSYRESLCIYTHNQFLTFQKPLRNLNSKNPILNLLPWHINVIIITASSIKFPGSKKIHQNILGRLTGDISRTDSKSNYDSYGEFHVAWEYLCWSISICFFISKKQHKLNISALIPKQYRAISS